jgi:hypothetical protein
MHRPSEANLEVNQYPISAELREENKQQNPVIEYPMLSGTFGGLEAKKTKGQKKDIHTLNFVPGHMLGSLLRR